MANLKASTVNGVLTLSSISGAAQTVPNSYGAYLHLGDWAVGRTATGAVLVNTAYRADYATDLLDMNISRFTNNSGYITANGATGANGNFYIDDNYGYGIVGLYESTRYQGVYAMGDAYKLAADGASTGTLYGLAWTHTNVGGESKSGLGHQLLIMDNGVTKSAIGIGIWTSGTITTTSHGTSANWNTAYGWGNHADYGYLTSLPSHNHDGSYLPIAGKAADSNLLDGLDLHTGRNNEANKVVRTDANGYIQAGWINTDSGNMGFGNRIARIQCSDDNYIRFQTLTEFKISMGLSGKNDYSRRIDYTEDTNYHVGSFGHGGAEAGNIDRIFHYGSGFFDVWSGNGTYAPGTSHIHGFNALHYTTGYGGSGYGWQMASQYNQTGLIYARWCSAGNFSEWQTIITSTNIGSQSVNYASSAGSVAWGNVSGRPSAVSSFTNDSGYITSGGRAYPRRSDGGDLNFYWSGQDGQPTWLWGGTDGANMYVYNPSNFSVNYAASAGSAPANGGRSDTVTINYSNDSNSTYQMLWGSGNSVYGTGLIYCNPSSDTMYARSYRGSDNVAGTGEAIHAPAGVYSQGTNWLYGTGYWNGNNIDGVGALYATIFYDRNDTGYYSDPTGTSNLEHLIINRIENYGWHTNSVWNTGGMFYVGEAGDGGAYPIQINAERWDLSLYSPNGPVWARGFQDLSDLRKKTAIADLENPLQKVLNLRGISYQWLDKPESGTHSGFIAQEVEEVLPHLVLTSIDPETLGEIKAVAYSEIIPYLVESIKLQQTYIENLEARLAALENNS